jgi:anti-sigma regulatory factor (Ser/Thr protein kinase)
MIGGASAVWAGCGGALPASATDETELGSGTGIASPDWPLVSTLPPLAALPTAPACARGHVRAVACQWGLADLADAAELVASELVTNAIQACDRLRIRTDPAMVPVVRIWLVSDRISLVIRVWDASDDMPVRCDTGPDDIGGRGLMIIDGLAKDWGSYRTTAGKVVWALIGPVP